MSVPNQTPYNIYTANGLSTVFTYEFYLITANDLQVTINGNIVTTGYTIAGVGNVSGGDVTFLTPPANGATVMLERVVPTFRLTDYQDNGDLLADTVNKDFDRIWMAIQRSFIYLGLALRRPLFGGPYNAEGYRIANLADPVNDTDAATKRWVQSQGQINLNKTLRVPENFVASLPPAVARANHLLAFNNEGNPISVLPESGSAADVLIDLASTEDGKGDALIGVKSPLPGSAPRTQHDVNQQIVSILDFPMPEGATKWDEPFKAACAALNGNGRLVFPLSGSAYYEFAGAFAASISAGLTIDVDPGVELGMPDVGYFHSTTRYARSFTMKLTALDSSIVVSSSTNAPGADRAVWFNAENRDKTLLTDLKPNNGDLSFFAYDQRTDTRTSSPPDATSVAGYAFTNSDLYVTKYGMIPVKNGEEISFIGAGASLVSVGIAGMIQCRGSRYWFWCDRDGVIPQLAAKVVGGGASSNPIRYQAQGTHSSYQMYKSVITIRKNSLRSFSIILNGFNIKTVDTDSDILEFGAGIQGAGSITVSNIVKRSNVPAVQGQFLRFAYFGDSLTADSMVNSWPSLLRDNLDGSCGIRISKNDNFAVAGASSAGQRAVMDTVNLGSYNVTVIMLGTNDVQGGVPVSDYIANMEYMIHNALNNGNTVIVGMFPLWYTRGQAGAHGQASSNYDQGKEHRSGLLKLIASYGYTSRIRLVDLTTVLGPVIADYINPALNPELAAQGLDPVVYDNIHLTYNSRILVAKAFGEAILSASSPTFITDVYLPVVLDSGMARNGWAIDTGNSFFLKTNSGLGHLEFTFNNTPATPPVDGTVICVLPKEMRPVKTVRAVVFADTVNARILVDHANGEIKIYGMTAGMYISGVIDYLIG